MQDLSRRESEDVTNATVSRVLSEWTSVLGRSLSRERRVVTVDGPVQTVLFIVAVRCLTISNSLAGDALQRLQQVKAMGLQIVALSTSDPHRASKLVEAVSYWGSVGWDEAFWAIAFFGVMSFALVFGDLGGREVRRHARSLREVSDVLRHP